jgi:hypothetical protein
LAGVGDAFFGARLSALITENAFGQVYLRTPLFSIHRNHLDGFCGAISSAESAADTGVGVEDGFATVLVGQNGFLSGVLLGCWLRKRGFKRSLQHLRHARLLNHQITPNKEKGLFEAFLSCCFQNGFSGTSDGFLRSFVALPQPPSPYLKPQNPKRARLEKTPWNAL